MANNLKKWMKKTIVILDQSGSRNPLYTAWTRNLQVPYIFHENYDENWIPDDSCSLLITAQHYQYTEFRILKSALDKNVPVLIIADGILEYRNTWLHPQVAPGSIFQPVMGHKIACIGRSQARILESWGNLGKCEVVGIPRFDRIAKKCSRHLHSGIPFRILVMTAKMPGFTPGQNELTERSLRDLKFWFLHNKTINGRIIEPVWRLTQHLEKKLAIKGNISNPDEEKLEDVLKTVDAVITTPSTAMLEAMKYGLPVALLDYNNCPHYVPAAWSITAPRHFDQTVPELVSPPSPKILFQNTVLHDALECWTPSIPRMLHLIEEMLRISEDCKARNELLSFPGCILSDTQHEHHFPEDNFNLAKLYPGHPFLSEMDKTVLQVEIGHLRVELRKLRKKVKIIGIAHKLLTYIPGPKRLLRLLRKLRAKSNYI